MEKTFICPKCGKKENLDKAFVEQLPIKQNTFHHSPSLWGRGQRQTITTYYQNFRFCQECGTRRNRIRNLASKSHLWVCGILFLLPFFYSLLRKYDIIPVDLNWMFTFLPASLILFIFYRVYKKVFIELFPITRENPEFSHACKCNAIGEKYDPKYSLKNIQYNSAIDSKTQFICSVCDKIKPIFGSSLYTYIVDQQDIIRDHFIVSKDIKANLRICGECDIEKGNRKKWMSFYSLIIISIPILIVLLSSIFRNEYPNIGALFVSIIISGILYLFIFSSLRDWLMSKTKYTITTKNLKKYKENNVISSFVN